jgi:hypothetical protein
MSISSNPFAVDVVAKHKKNDLFWASFELETVLERFQDPLNDGDGLRLVLEAKDRIPSEIWWLLFRPARDTLRSLNQEVSRASPVMIQVMYDLSLQLLQQV